MIRCLVLTVVLGMHSTAALGQTASGKADAATADDPDAKSIATASENRVVLEAGDADAKATGRLAHAFDLPNDDYRARYALTVVAPFDRKKADRVDVGTLSGLTAGTSATLELGASRWAQAGDADIDAVLAVCEKFIPLLLPGYSWRSVAKASGELCRSDLFETEAIAALVKKLNSRRTNCAACVDVPGKPASMCRTLREGQQRSCLNPDGTAVAVCALLERSVREDCAVCDKLPATETVSCGDLSLIDHDAKPADDIETLLIAANRELLPATAKLFRPLSTLTLALKANQLHFDYVLADDLATARTADERGVGIAVAFTHVLRSSAWVLGYSHEKSYQGSDAVQVCTPLNTEGATSCKQAIIGAPKRDKAEIAFAEARIAFGKAKFAIAPRSEFDFKQSNWALRLPIYFIANKDQQLTAGFAVGYSEAEKEKKKDAWGASVFISKAFSFY